MLQLNMSKIFSRWEPIEKLVWLSAPSLLLNIIVLSYDWSSVGREDTVRSALDILSVCAILPRVQMSLCENVAFPGEKTKGEHCCLDPRWVRHSAARADVTLRECRLPGGEGQR